MKKIKIILLVVLICSFCFSAYKIYSVKQEILDSEQIKHDLIELIEIPEETIETEDFNIDFSSLQNINSDVIGWILVEGTQINYPIVQGENNYYYLNHSFDKKWNSLGSIFADYRSSNDFSDYNTFIYGHHTKNGSMFGELYKYMNEAFLREHPTYMLYTPSGNYIAEIFSAYIDNTTSESYNQKFNSIEEYKKYIDMIKEKSNYKTEVDVNTKEDKIITLYSCSHESNRQKTDRYYIHAVLRSV